MLTSLGSCLSRNPILKKQKLHLSSPEGMMRWVDFPGFLPWQESNLDFPEVSPWQESNLDFPGFLPW
jgi:hypothetical protein